MDIVGIICEYNPFHNGHIYHLKKIKEMFPNSLIILVMSGNFTERGIPSILDKWDKTEISLKYGIDLVIELPFCFATQSADIFAHGSIAILKELKANYLVFGSETNQVDKLIDMAKYSLTDTNYQLKIKEYLDKGYNYPTALNKAFDNKFMSINNPNDLLGLSYIKEIIKQKSNIIPVTIKRTNSYHSKELEDISSATSIRNALINNKDISLQVPEIVIEKLRESKTYQEDYFQLLKYKILSEKDLTIYQTVDEGIDKRIKDNIIESNNWNDLVKKIKTKRYTYNRINRMLVHILCNFTKEKAKSFKEIEYIRVLGFSNEGRKYLNKIKKDLSVPLISTFSKGNSNMLKYEQDITNIYSLPHNRIDIIKKEYQHKPIIKK